MYTLMTVNQKNNGNTSFNASYDRVKVHTINFSSILHRYNLLFAVFVASCTFAAPDALVLGDGHDGILTLVGTDFDLAPFYGNVDTNVSAGDTVINYSGPIINTGDIVLIIQMTGATATSADISDVNVTTSGTGQYEFRLVDTSNPGNFTFTDGLDYSYTAEGSQIFVVPQYASVNLINDATLSIKNWDGSTGGVGAVFVQGEISLDATSIFVGTGTGYRGGLTESNDSYSDCILDLKTSANGGGAPKGEGITGIFGTGDLESAYGNYANGGGGGNCHGSGGGGGGNGGAGGDGGYLFEEFGGIGGSRMVVSDHDTHALMGGGGGTGERHQDGDTEGAAGGGIWFIRAETFAGGMISAGGGDASFANGDGAGGGGAGGTIIAHIHGTMSCGGAPGLFTYGGDGGDVGSSHSPGGGGGGGVLRVRYDNFISCLVDVSFGNNGLVNGNSNGATNGNLGVTDICIDSDYDGSCNTEDLCIGLDYTGDTDNDGLCDNIDDPDDIFKNSFESIEPE